MNDDAIIQKLKDHDDQLESIARVVVHHTEVLVRIEENMVTKREHEEVMDALDKLIRLSEKRDQEMTFMGSRMKRIEDDVLQLKTGLA